MSERTPPGIDVSTPNVARIYDCLLDGKDNFAADREAAGRIVRAFPEAREGVRRNREFLGNAVRYLAAEAGIRQFVDIGAGLPTQNNVHEVAHSVEPEARTVYVDNDGVVCVHGRALLAGAPTVAVVEADLRHPEDLCASVTDTGLIDFGRPVAVLLVAMLHFLEDPAKEVAWLRDMVAPGSHLVITHLTPGDGRSRDTERVQQIYARASRRVFPRTVQEIRGFFGDFALLDTDRFIAPEVSRDFAILGWGGVARKS